GVEASIINADSGPVLVINANDVGTDNQVTISVDDVDTNNTDAQGLSQLSFDPSDIPGSNLTQANAALDAQITVNGQTVTSNSGNVFSDVISNVSITALAETTSAGTVTITKDIDQATSAVSDFVDSFNALTTSVKDLGRAGSEDGATGGILVGNSVLRSLSGQLRSVIFNVIDETQPEGLRTLSDIGINIDREGRLALDSSKLASLLETNFDDVARLLAADGNAIAQNQQLQSLSFGTVNSEVGEGDLTISVGDTSFTVVISAGAANNTLQGVRDSINAAGDNAGVTASIILVDDGLGGTNAQLILTADEVGDESAIAITVVDGSDGDNEDTFGLSRLASVNLTENVASTLDAPSGIVLRLQDVVAGFLGGGGEVGIIDTRTQGLTRDIDRIDDERLVEQNRLNAFQDRLTRQFAGLDLLVANLTASGDFLLSQLSSISEISKSRNSN
ncbi:MAG: flagellar filament capping protein FliD, partial [Pseudomonadales bacterium]|nr:flagellar filament capping protein FliD [Pseudomonadales bacterium]